MKYIIVNSRNQTLCIKGAWHWLDDIKDFTFGGGSVFDLEDAKNICLSLGYDPRYSIIALDNGEE